MKNLLFLIDMLSMSKIATQQTLGYCKIITNFFLLQIRIHSQLLDEGASTHLSQIMT